MKHTLGIIGLVLMVVVTGCTNQAPAPTETQEESQSQLKSEDASPKEKNDFHDYLRLMDEDMDAVEKGGYPQGSFSDYFAPNASDALKAGASRQEVEARVERVIALAKKKIYLSDLVARLMSEGGPEAIRSYTWGWIEQAQKVE